MAKLRHEINILGAVLDNTASSGSPALVQIDTTKYSGSVSYYFEIVYKNTSASTDDTLTLKDLTGGDVDVTGSSITMLKNTSTYTRARSSAMTLTSGAREYHTSRITVAAATVASAKVIVIQDTGSDPVTSTESQFEIGGQQSSLSLSVVPLTNPKYWTYTAADWDGTKTFYAEVCYIADSNMSPVTVRLEEDNGSFASWTTKVTIVNGGTYTAFNPASRVRVAFTPTDGRHYRIVIIATSTMSGITIYNGKIIVDQGGETLQTSQTTGGAVNQIQGGTASSGESFQAAAASFNAGATYSMNRLELALLKTGTPTDNLYCEIVTGSINGTVIATSNNVSATGLTGSVVFTSFTFPSLVPITNGTKYWIRLFRTGSRDTSNYASWQVGIGNPVANAGAYTRDNNTWSSESALNDGAIKTYSTESITKLEEQYLLLNTGDAGTGLQNYPTLWDSSEWSGVTNTYKHAIDSDNASNSAKLQDIDNSNTDVTGSTATGNNQQLSSAMTMPTTGHQLNVNVTNSTGIIGASRIISYVSVVAGAADLSVTVSDSITLTDTPSLFIPFYTPRVSDSITVTENTSVATGVTVVLLGSSFDTNSGTHTVTVTPDPNDLIVIVTANSGNTASTTPTDDNAHGGTYVEITSALKNTSADKLAAYIRTEFIQYTNSTIFTHAPGVSTGGGLAVFAIRGMHRVGLAAIKQTAKDDNQAGAATPTPTFASAVLAKNPVISAVFNAANPGGITARTNYTRDVDTGWATPTSGVDIMHRNTSETATAIAWGSTSSSAYCDLAFELDTDFTATETQQDTFPGSSLDATKWYDNTQSGATQSVGSNAVTLTVPAGTPGGLAEVESQYRYDLTRSYVLVKAVVTQVASANAVAKLVAYKNEYGNQLEISLSNGSLYCGYFIDGSFTTINTVSYNATTMAWWRIRESAGTIYFDYGSDGLSWTNLGSVSVATISVLDITLMRVSVATYNGDSSGTAEVGVFSNFNVNALQIAVSDSLTVTESVLRLLTSNPAVSDSITVSEAITREIISFITTSDTITLSESILRLLVSLLRVSDSITLTESTSFQMVSSFSVSDTITTTETITISLPDALRINVSESVTVSESATVAQAGIADLTISVSDTITLSESLSLLVILVIAVSDSPSLSESITVRVESFITKSDSITVSESNTIATVYTFQTTETIRTRESFGSAVNLDGDGASRIFALGPSPAATATTPITLSAWVRLGADGANVANSQPVLMYRYWYIYFRETQTRPRIRFDESVAHEIADATSYAGVTDWIHVVGTYNPTGGSNSVLKIYVNGALKNTSATQTALPTVDRGTSQLVGGVVSGKSFNGDITDVRVFHDLLDDTQVATLYSDGSNPDGINPVIWYPIIDGTGTTITDFSGNGNTGTLISNATLIESTTPQAGNVHIELTTGNGIRDRVTLSESVSISQPYFPLTVSDSVTITESSVVRPESFINLSDSITVAENSIIVLPDALAIAVSDNITISEFAGVSMGYTVIAQETIVLSESTSLTTSDPQIIVSDSISTTESAKTQLVSLVTVSDSISVTESGNQELNSGVVTSDNISTSESTILNIPIIVSVSDSLTISEASSLTVASAADLNISVSDTITLTEAASLLIAISISVSDSITITESISENVVAFITVSDTISVDDIPWYYDDEIVVTESVSLVVEGATLILTVSDTVTLTENIILQNPTLSFSVSDSTTLTENVKSEIQSLIAVSEAISLTDTISLALTIQPLVSEAITITEGIALLLVSLITASDTVSVTESTSVVLPNALAISVADSISLSEFSAVTFGFAIAQQETITVSEATALKVSDPQISSSDTVTLSDQVAIAVPLTVIVSDTITASEAVVILLINNAVVYETISASENTLLEVTQSVTVSDTITMTESVLIQLVSLLTVADTITTTDSPSVTIRNVDDLLISVFDSLTVSEAFTPSLNSDIRVSESISVTETITPQETITITTSDTIIPAEALTIALPVTISVTDTVTATESSKTVLLSDVVVTDSITLSESTTMVLPNALQITASDTVTLSEFAAAAQGFSAAVQDTITTTESVTIQMGNLQIAASETITVTESSTVSILYTVSVADTVTVSDGQGGTLTFDGSQNYLSLGTMGSFGSQIGNGFYTAFDLTTTETRARDIMGVENTIGAPRVEVFLNNGNISGRLGVYIIDLASPTLKTLRGYCDTSVNDGQKHRVVISVVMNTNTINISIDGVAQSITYTAQNTPTTFFNFDTPFTVGAFNQDGTVGSYAAFTIGNLQLGTSSNNIFASYAFTEGSGTTTADGSGNGNTGTLTGTPKPTWGPAIVATTVRLISNVTASDTVAVAESVAFDLPLALHKTETISITEAVNPLLVSQRSVSDSITVSESATVSLSELQLAVQETITLTDQVNLATENNITVSDDITITEITQFIVPISLQTSETLAITEAVQVVPSGDLSVVDTITVSESVLIVLSAPQVAVSETITVTDVPNMAHVLQVIATTDTITLSESVNLDAPHLVEYISRKLIMIDGRLAYLVVDAGIPHYIFLD